MYIEDFGEKSMLENNQNIIEMSLIFYFLFFIKIHIEVLRSYFNVPFWALVPHPPTIGFLHVKFEICEINMDISIFSLYSMNNEK